MAARFPQSATSVAYRIKSAYSSKVLAIYWAATADSVHRLYSADTASTIITRSTSGAGFNATDGRITGNFGTAVFEDSKTGGLGTTEDASLTYIAAYYGDLFNGASNTWAIGCATPMDAFTNKQSLKVDSSYAVNFVRSGSPLGSNNCGGGDDVAAFMVFGLRHVAADPTARYRAWANGAELTGLRSTSSPSSTAIVGDASNALRFGGTALGTGNTKLEGECWLVATDLSDAEMDAITADPSIVIEVAPATPTITGPSGAAGAGTSTANIAENATTGPTFSTDISLGGGYPSLTGTQAANWGITVLSSTSWRLDPVAAFNFEASPTNPQTVVFNASASVAQTCTITIVNMPEFSGTVPAQSGITGTSFSLDLSPYFGTGSFTYAIASGSLTGSGLSLNTSSGVISGTLGTVAVYTVTVSAAGAIGSAVNTNSFTITVSSTGTAPTVSTHPSNTTVTAGATASFTAAAGGSPTPTVQWQENTGSWTNISGQTTTTLSLGVVGTVDSGRQFRAVFTNSSGSATTNAATLTVNAAAGDGTITSEPLGPNLGGLNGAGTLTWVGFRNASTGADVLLLTNVSINSSSVFTTGLQSALAPGQLYAINWKTSDGKYGYAWANAV